MKNEYEINKGGTNPDSKYFLILDTLLRNYQTFKSHEFFESIIPLFVNSRAGKFDIINV